MLLRCFDLGLYCSFTQWYWYCHFYLFIVFKKNKKCFWVVSYNCELCLKSGKETIFLFVAIFSINCCTVISQTTLLLMGYLTAQRWWVKLLCEGFRGVIVSSPLLSFPCDYRLLGAYHSWNVQVPWSRLQTEVLLFWQYSFFSLFFFFFFWGGGGGELFVCSWLLWFTTIMYICFHCLVFRHFRNGMLVRYKETDKRIQFMRKDRMQNRSINAGQEE